MEATKKVVQKIYDSLDVILIVYSLKRWNKLPQKYNKLVYALVLSPIMLTLAWRHPDRIASRYRNFLVRFCYPEIRSLTGIQYKSCDTHKELGNTPPNTPCTTLFVPQALKTLRNVSRLYIRFYVIQMIIVALVKKKFEVKMLTQTAENILRSTAFLAGQTIVMRAELCIANYYGIKWDDIKMWLVCYLCSFCIFFERSDRVGQINNLVFAHVFIGWLKKIDKLRFVSLPMFLTTLVKDKGKINPITSLIAVVSALIAF